jgi:hypothetical protein
MQKMIQLDAHLSVIRGALEDGFPEDCALAETSWGIVEVAGLGGDDLAALLETVLEHRTEDEVVEAFALRTGYAHEDVRGVLAALARCGVIAYGDPDQRPAIWDELFAPAEPPPSGEKSGYRRVAVVGSGSLAARIAKALGAEGIAVEHVRPPMTTGTGSSKPPVEIFATAHGRRPPPATSGVAKPGDGEDDALFSGFDMVVLALEDAPFGRLLELHRSAIEAECRVLPVVVRGRGIDVGPLFVPNAPGVSLRAALFPLISDDGTLPAKLAVCDALTLRDAAEVDDALVVRAVDTVGRTLRDPSRSMMVRSLHVGPASIEEALLPLPTPEEIFLSASGVRELDLRTYLSPHLRDERLLAAIRASFAAGELIILRDAFERDFAEAIHGALDRVTAWGVYEQRRPYFHSHRHALYERSDFCAELRTLELVFNSESTIELIESLVGDDCRMPTIFTPTWYMSGDHSTPHPDTRDGRKIAFAWHLTKEWRPDWGGDFYWCASGTPVPPTFNSLLLFKVSRSTTHVVVDVAPHARGKRLAISGWWRGSSTLQEVREARALDEAKRVLVLPGGTKVSVTEALTGRAQDLD